MFEEDVVGYDGKRIVPTKLAQQQLVDNESNLEDVVAVLEQGYFSPRKRRWGTVEKWLNKGRKVVEAVVVEKWDEAVQENIWLLIHFGKFTRK